MQVSSDAPPRRTAQVTEETRGLILAAAETEFAARGFASARLEDIAERVGITRAAVIYHFGDKEALYDAVLQASFEPLGETILASVTEPGSSEKRLERVIEAWFNYASERPTLGRLFIREFASAEGALRPEVERMTTPMFMTLLKTIEQGQRDNEFRAANAVHVANILSGAVIWLTSGADLMGGDGPESRAERLAQYREELAGVARHLLGIRPQDEERESGHE
ncbi:MAG: TetR/AcrR family transcriptional regulator [Deltaproteobacteria bacterium]|nr:TetR/AcrR family transcriptional regulator [Deltaproteobacteria bacterium]MBW2445665.1 TetR/AcrR family transcriptional regulator [Deltaproteobacteria bacterium]